MSWLTFAILSLFTMVGSNLFMSKAAKTRRVDSVALAVAYHSVKYVLTTLYAVLYLAPEVSNLTDIWPIVLLNALLFSLGHTLAFISFKYLDVSLQVIIGSTSTIYSVILATLLLGESINLIQWIGLLLILFAVTLVNIKKGKSKNIRKGLFYGFSSAVVYGFAVTVGKHLFNQVDLGTFFIVGSIPVGLFMFVGLYFYVRFEKKHFDKLISRPAWAYIALGGSLLALSDIFFFNALNILDNISRLVAITTFSTILTVIAGIFFFKEKRYSHRKLVSATIATIGFLLLI